ncbi:MAG: DUF6210 family protein [Pyrinomonadaceae bacterium]
MESKPIISLDGFDGLGLIVNFACGVLYTNQVAGHACLHPEAEGVFAPLPVKVGRPEIYALQQHFRGDWHPLSGDDANVVDSILKRNGLAYLKVDSSKLHESYEAWVNVIIGEALEGISFNPMDSFAGRTGILTWQNSD